MINSVSSPTMLADLDPSRTARVGGTAAVTGANPAAPAAAVAEPQVSDFASVLGRMAMDAAEVVRSGEATAAAGVRGQASVQQVVEAVMAAEQTLMTGIAVRDKVVSAYLEISRMQI